MLWSPNSQLLYPFENQANDYSGNARHGTVNGSGVYATRPYAGRCLYFDGVGDYVSTPSFGLSGTVVVFAAWVRCKFNATKTQTLLSDAAQSQSVPYIFCYRVSSGDALVWQYTNGVAYFTPNCSGYFTPPYNDVWLHLCIVCDYAGKYIYFYRAGRPCGPPISVDTPLFPSIARVHYVGCYNPTWNLLTDGYMAGVYLGTLAAMQPVPQMTANVNRLMLGMNPIW